MKSEEFWKNGQGLEHKELSEAEMEAREYRGELLRLYDTVDVRAAKEKLGIHPSAKSWEAGASAAEVKIAPEAIAKYEALVDKAQNTKEEYYAFFEKGKLVASDSGWNARYGGTIPESNVETHVLYRVPVGSASNEAEIAKLINMRKFKDLEYAARENNADLGEIQKYSDAAQGAFYGFEFEVHKRHLKDWGVKEEE